MKKTVLLLLSAVAFSSLLAQSVTTITTWQQFRDAFNAECAYPRVVYFNDPYCPPCVTDHNAVWAGYHTGCPGNQKIKGLYVWIGYLAPQANLAKAQTRATEYNDPRIKHYWDEYMVVSRKFSALGVRYIGTAKGALIYKAGVRWDNSDSIPPIPQVAMGPTWQYTTNLAEKKYDWDLDGSSFRDDLMTIAGCSATSSPVACQTVTGVSDNGHAYDQISVFPIPAIDGIVVLNIPEFKESTTVRIYNMLGEELISWQVAVNSSTVSKIDLSLFGRGMYLVQISGESQSITKKVIY